MYSAVVRMASASAAVVRLHRGAVDAAEAQQLFDELLNGVNWRVENDDFGPQQRQTFYCADEGCVFRYVGLKLVPNPWPTQLLLARKKVAAAVGMPEDLFTACLLNRYDDNEGSIGWHYDEVHTQQQAMQESLVPNTAQASLR
eukprot:6176418-Pleurochrysis_carterae.AAC.3